MSDIGIHKSYALFGINQYFGDYCNKASIHLRNNERNFSFVVV